MFRTTDGGVSWERVLYENDRTGAADLALDTRNPSVLYASLWEAVDDEMRGGVHAFAVHTDTQDAWARTGAGAPESPKCLGGKAGESA